MNYTDYFLLNDLTSQLITSDQETKNKYIDSLLRGEIESKKIPGNVEIVLSKSTTILFIYPLSLI